MFPKDKNRETEASAASVFFVCQGTVPWQAANGKQQIKTEACNRCRPLLLFTYY